MTQQQIEQILQQHVNFDSYGLIATTTHKRITDAAAAIIEALEQEKEWLQIQITSRTEAYKASRQANEELQAENQRLHQIIESWNNDASLPGDLI